jgi:hypothetical protein
VLSAANTMFYVRLALREEEALIVAQGEPSLAYELKVPRIVPSLTARAPFVGANSALGSGVRGRELHAGLAVVTLLFALTP